MSALSITQPMTAYMSILRDEKINNFSSANAFDELVDLISIRIQNKHIDEVAEGLKAKIFDARLDVIHGLSGEKEDIENYLDHINQKISTIQHELHHAELFNTLKDSLFIFQKIINEIFNQKQTDNSKEIQIDLQNNRPTYGTFLFLQSHPHPQTRYFTKFLDASLKLDVGILITEKILSGKINLDQKRIQQELIPFLNKTIDRFGAYSIFTEFWKPEKDDHSPETYKMQILADTIRMNNGLQPLFLENEEDLEDVGLALAMEEVSAVKECVDTETFLNQLRGFVEDDGGNEEAIYGNWNNIQETLLLLNDKRAVDAIREAHENRKNGIINEGKTIEEVFTDV